MSAPVQDALFTAAEPTPVVVSGVRAGRFSPAGSDAALAGDGLGWLAAFLPAPVPPTCETCGQPMVLPSVPVLWACPACHPREAAA